MKVALYISLFPQLVAGPIVRYSTIARQIDARKTGLDDLTAGVRRFVIGLSKKVLLADRLAELADFYFDAPPDMCGHLTIAGLWLGALAYVFQIYFDFSGYSDMAIGLGRVFGFHFEENFNQPYLARSITDFWRRWHISLSQWFRDYVYIPLGGNRVGKSRLAFNLFIVWSLTGLWHGANWTFVVWGFGYFLLLAGEKFLDRSRWPRWLSVFARPYTLLCVTLLWVLFRSWDLSRCFAYWKGMFGLGGLPGAGPLVLSQLREYGIWLILAGVASFAGNRLMGLIQGKGGALWVVAKECVWILLLAMAMASVANSSYSPFIYFNF